MSPSSDTHRRELRCPESLCARAAFHLPAVFLADMQSNKNYLAQYITKERSNLIEDYLPPDLDVLDVRGRVHCLGRLIDRCW
jgi:hypothetical protein